MFSGFNATAPLLPEILALHGKWRAADEAVICGDRRLNWGEFCAINHRLAHGLNSRGISRGDTIGIVMSNDIEMLQAMMASMAIGAISVPINLSVSDTDLAKMLCDAGVKAIVASSDQLPRIDAIKQNLPDSLDLLLADVVDRHCAGSDWIDFETITQHQSELLPEADLQEQDILNIIYSSGTTGLPKGIMHTQMGRRDYAYDLSVALRYHGKTKTLLTIGMYSNISWLAMMCTLFAGGTLVIHKRFDATAFLRTVAEERITHTAMVPIQFQRVSKLLEQAPYDLSSMQAMMSCGSPMHPQLKQKIFEQFPCGIVELYGLTEGIITTMEPEQAPGRWNSVGKPLLGTDIKIIDDCDRELPWGESGEIVSRGRITMPGYHRRPEASSEACYSDAQGRDWLRSGDIGCLDSEGFLYIVDRKKDMILSGGQNIYPQDIEALIVTHESVDDVAVVAAKSRRWGETPIALVVVDKTCAENSAAEIQSWSNAKLGKQQRLTDLIFVEELPRNPNGKILKRELRKRYADRYYD